MHCALFSLMFDVLFGVMSELVMVKMLVICILASGIAQELEYRSQYVTVWI